ncbi:MAG: agmatine deiminase family protein [Myxococcota bacterium]|nr:agmatine deiminase family protein [Myxococcota bacterium]
MNSPAGCVTAEGVSQTASGVRWPAEWERHDATWLSWPHNVETWPGQLEAVEAAFVEMVRALVPHERVHINAGGEALTARVRDRLAIAGIDPEHDVELHEVETDDAWVRDHGAIFVQQHHATATGRRETSRVALDFRFNAWGGKYPPWSRDDAVAAAMAKHIGAEHRRIDFVLEGGSIEGNGAGSVITTESCLLNPNRNPRADGSPPTRDEVEAELRDALAVDQVIWLAGGVEGDDTDGHIDDVARFVAEDRIVCVREDDAHDPNAAVLAENWSRLRAARTPRGQPYDLVSLPMPPPIEHAGDRLPASYANFYLANDVALVPVFDVPTDARALAVLADCLPGREIVAIEARSLVLGLGAVHCLTQQVPA